jgi:hypothetical protein
MQLVPNDDCLWRISGEHRWQLGFTVILCRKLIMSLYAMNNYKYMKILFQI